MDPSICNVNADYLLIFYVSCVGRAGVCVSVCVVTVKLRKYAKNNTHLLTHSNTHTFARAHTQACTEGEKWRDEEREREKRGRENDYTATTN